MRSRKKRKSEKKNGENEVDTKRERQKKGDGEK